MPLYYNGARSRAAHILGLVPTNPNDSGAESDCEENMSEEALEREMESLFAVIAEEDQSNEEPVFMENYVLDDGNLSEGPPLDQLDFVSEEQAVPDVQDEQHQDESLIDLVNCQPGPSSVTTTARISNTRKKKRRQRRNLKIMRKPSKNQAKKKKPTFRWKKEKFVGQVSLPTTVTTTPLLFTANNKKTPYQYFKHFFTDELLQMITTESNRYTLEKKGISPRVTIDDLRDFLSIEISMGIVKLGGWKKYWNEKTRVPRVADAMPRNKYAKVRSSLHFVSKEEEKAMDSTDKFIKVRPVVEYLRQKFIGVQGLDRKFSVDEMMIPYKGKKAGSRKQYMPKKPTKWGFKVFARCGVSGFVYDFFLYGGDSSFGHINFTSTEQSQNFSSKSVIALYKTIETPALAAVFFDNFFSSLGLMNILREEYGILSIGTMRANRVANADKVLTSDKELLKKGRGSFDEVADNKKQVTIVKWADTKVVTLGSSYIGASPVDSVSRWSNEQKKRVKVPCPKIVREYNSFMGGVDKSDMLVTLYKTPLRTFKWYMTIFVHFLDLSLNNAWLLYNADNPDMCMSLADFKLNVSDSLLLHNRRIITSNARTPPKTCDDIRLDGFDHMPHFGERGRCRLCQKCQTAVLCKKCNARLCLRQSKNCFAEYHLLAKLPRKQKNK